MVEPCRMASRRAFSILEVLLAAVLMGLGLLALIGVQIYSLKAGKGTTGRYTASVVASSVLNDCEALLKEDFSADLNAPRAPAPDYPGYDFSVTASNENANLKRVRVTVYWKDEQGLAQTYVLWTKLVR